MGLPRFNKRMHNSSCWELAMAADRRTARWDVTNMPSPTDIRENGARITASAGFSNSERLCELLRYTVMEALEGRGASLKEPVLCVTVFGLIPGYDSDANSILRLEFARLLKQLERYD